MKKRIVYMMTAAILLLSLLAACGRSEPKSGEPAPTETGITATEAENIALTHAGLTRNDIDWILTEKDYDDGVSRYEVDFRKGVLEYEYEIRSSDGHILSYDKERD